MTTQLTANQKSKLFILTGLAINLVLFGLRGIMMFDAQRELNFIGDSFMSYFFIGYILLLLYFLFVLGFRNKLKSESREKFRTVYLVSLAGFNISAYILNQVMDVFSEFAPWVHSLIVLNYLSILAIAFKDSIPEVLKTILHFIIGLSMIFSLYQFIYLFPIIPYGLAGGILIGIGFHAFVPILNMVAFAFYIKEEINIRNVTSLAIGLIFPFVVTSIFLNRWSKMKSIIAESQTEKVLNQNDLLPEWVLNSEKINEDMFSRMIILGPLVYDDRLFDMDRIGGVIGFDDRKIHDPLVGLAMTLYGDINMDRGDRIKILESVFDERHQTYRRLWTGQHLRTENIISQANIYPDLRMAYVEKDIYISNNGVGQEEAIYTFYLPEGAVATSLSLWVNGVEEKSRLTTRCKADIAYAQIVGVQKRDPALLHWQEGNEITVSVFPCTKQEQRHFKVGFSIPLSLSNQFLTYSDVQFKGPDFKSASHTSIINFMSNEDVKITLNSGYKKMAINTYKSVGKYHDHDNIKFKTCPISNRTFVFENRSYRMEECNEPQEELNIKNIYLDINSSWTMKELESILNAYENQVIYYDNDGLKKLDRNLISEVLSIKSRSRFNLFPLWNIVEPNTSLLITKSVVSSPNVGDLKNTEFISRVKLYTSQFNQTIHVFDLNDSESSPFTKAMNEFGIFSVKRGTIDDLIIYSKGNNYWSNVVEDNCIYIKESGVKICMNESRPGDVSFATDHLMRFYNYGCIKRGLRSDFFDMHDCKENELIALAEKAHIASPLSSMIVLESQKDYENFDIQKKLDGLKNATIKSSGSVPEPHEWVMIILVVMLLTWTKFKIARI